MRVFLIILIALFINLCFGQNISFEWQSCFGGTDTESTESNKSNQSIMVKDGYLFMFSTESDDGDVQSGNHNGGSRDLWLIKTDLYGNMIWEKTYGGSGHEYAGSILKISEDYYYLYGVTSSDDGDVQSGNQGERDYWLVKIDKDGNIIWEKTYGGSSFDRMGKAILAPDGGVYIYGSTFSTDGDVTGHSGYYLDQWLFKVSPEGEFEKGKCFGGGGQNFVGDIMITDDGGLLISGTLYEGLDVGVTQSPLFGLLDIWIIKLNANWEIEWDYVYGGSGDDSNSRFLKEDGKYTICGASDSNDGLVNKRYGDADIWIFSIDYNGQFLNSNVIGGSDIDFATNIFKNQYSNNYTIIGGTKSYNHDVSGNHCGQANYCWFDIWYVELNSSFEILHQRCIGAWGDQTPGGVLKLDDGHFIISAIASKGEDDYDITCDLHMPYTAGDVWLFEIRDCDLYPPTIPSQPIGQDTICTLSYSKSIYTTNIANPQYEEGEWYLEPTEAGELTNRNDTVLINWNTDYEGQVALSVRSTSSCGESEYSEPKNIVVRACVGIGEINKKSLFLYPNPATNQITFELPHINKQSEIQIKDIYGKLIITLIIKPNQSKLIWECSGFASGVYFYHVELSGEVYRGKLIIN